MSGRDVVAGEILQLRVASECIRWILVLLPVSTCVSMADACVISLIWLFSCEKSSALHKILNLSWQFNTFWTVEGEAMLNIKPRNKLQLFLLTDGGLFISSSFWWFDKFSCTEFDAWFSSSSLGNKENRNRTGKISLVHRGPRGEDNPIVEVQHTNIVTVFFSLTEY